MGTVIFTQEISSIDKEHLFGQISKSRRDLGKSPFTKPAAASENVLLVREWRSSYKGKRLKLLDRVRHNVQDNTVHVRKRHTPAGSSVI